MCLQKIKITDDPQCKYVIRVSKNSLGSLNLDFDGDNIFIAAFHSQAAKTALKNYKNTQKGDGYLVNFSVESITKLADVMDLEQSTTTEETEKELSPATEPLKNTGDEVSQEDVVILQLF